MVTKEKYTELLNSGLLLDHYFVLCNIKNGLEQVKSKRVQGFINLLVKKGYIEEDVLTIMGIELIEEVELKVEPIKSSSKQQEFNEWVVDIHTKCQQKLKDLTGTVQVRSKINNVGYSFLPNSVDFGKNLYKVITAYKLKDYEKIEKCIMAFIQSRYDAKQWFPLLGYYIMKNNKSQLVTDYENFGDEPQAKALSEVKFL